MSKKRMITKSVIFLLILAFILKIFSSLSITMGYNANPLRLSIQGGFYMNNKGRYHNDYSPRYQDAFDIYEKAKNHAKEQRKKERLHSLSVVEQEHRNRSGDDNTISNKTPHVRNLSKKQKSKDGGEDNL